MTMYLVSGAPDIVPSDVNLRRTGRRIRYDTQVAGNAAAFLRAGRRYVVVAHGNHDGTVTWFRSDANENSRWLWVGMSPAPRGARVYLYCCNAGPKLARFLKHCECIGHSAPVPAPVNEATAVVLTFLDEVDRLMRSPRFDASDWKAKLAEFVNEQWNNEIDQPTSILASALWLLLSDSLRN
jgi:hypothetical protein